MGCATDEGADDDVDAAHCKTVVAGPAPVGGCIGHMAAAETGRMDERNEMVYSIVRLTEREREMSAKLDSCHSLIVAARVVHVVEEQAAEVVRSDIHSGKPQAD